MVYLLAVTHPNSNLMIAMWLKSNALPLNHNTTRQHVSHMHTVDIDVNAGMSLAGQRACLLISDNVATCKQSCVRVQSITDKQFTLMCKWRQWTSVMSFSYYQTRWYWNFLHLKFTRQYNNAIVDLYWLLPTTGSVKQSIFKIMSRFKTPSLQ